MTDLQFSIISKSPNELPCEILESYLDLQEAVGGASRTGEILRSRDYRRAEALSPPRAGHVIKRYYAVIDNRVVGYSFLDYTTHAQNSEQVEYFGMVHPELRRKGIATALYVEMEKYGLELGKTKPEMWFSPEESPGNADFAKKLGYSPATEEKVSRLHKENISWDYVNSREEQYRDLESRYQLLFLSRKEWADLILADQEMAVEMADFVTETVNLIPREDFEMEDYKETPENLVKAAERILKTPHQDGQNVYAIEPETRRIVAMSGTFFANDPPIRDIGTGLTAVRKAYQRQGLATYLKIKVLRHFIQTLPQFEFIFTENAASNQGMLSINYNLGFRTEFSWEGWQKKYEE